MAEAAASALAETHPLDGRVVETARGRLEVIAGRALVIATCPRSARPDADGSGSPLPPIGHVATIDERGTEALGLGALRWLMISDPTGGATPDDPLTTNPQLEGVRVVDQSDGLVCLRLHGEGAVDAMRRLCRIDVDGEALAPGRCVTTVIDHLTITIVRDADDTFRLIGPRSTADDLFHAAETALRNVG
ncbi:MAG: hypothetical protein AAFQ45_09380 [Pseudomonadota bacterium]